MLLISFGHADLSARIFMSYRKIIAAIGALLQYTAAICHDALTARYAKFAVQILH